MVGWVAAGQPQRKSRSNSRSNSIVQPRHQQERKAAQAGPLSQEANGEMGEEAEKRNVTVLESKNNLILLIEEANKPGHSKRDRKRVTLEVDIAVTGAKGYERFTQRGGSARLV